MHCEWIMKMKITKKIILIARSRCTYSVAGLPNKYSINYYLNRNRKTNSKNQICACFCFVLKPFTNAVNKFKSQSLQIENGISKKQVIYIILLVSNSALFESIQFASIFLTERMLCLSNRGTWNIKLFPLTFYHIKRKIKLQHNKKRRGYMIVWRKFTARWEKL